jgi:hypothetical protein
MGPAAPPPAGDAHVPRGLRPRRRTLLKYGETLPIGVVADGTHLEVTMTRLIPAAFVALNVVATVALTIAPWTWG